jgi:hypothetical protein
MEMIENASDYKDFHKNVEYIIEATTRHSIRKPSNIEPVDGIIYMKTGQIYIIATLSLAAFQLHPSSLVQIR